MCLSLVSVFRRRDAFKLLTSKVHGIKLPKNQVLEKSDPLTDKYQNFATKVFTGACIHVFLPSFVEIGKAEVTKLVRSIMTKNCDILPLFLRLTERSQQKFCRTTLFSIPHPSAKFCPNSSGFRGDVSEN